MLATFVEGYRVERPQGLKSRQVLGRLRVAGRFCDAYYDQNMASNDSCRILEAALSHVMS